MRTGAHAAERSLNLVAARTATKFSSRKDRTRNCDGHVAAGWLKQVEILKLKFLQNY